MGNLLISTLEVCLSAFMITLTWSHFCIRSKTEKKQIARTYSLTFTNIQEQ